ARAREEFFAAKKQPVIFSAGRIWDEAKNIDLLVKAAQAIPYSIRIAGSNRFDNEAYEVPTDHVVYLGRLSAEEVAIELASAAVYVLPARYEPFGLSALEAALSGCALVLGDIGSLREIWEDN